MQRFSWPRFLLYAERKKATIVTTPRRSFPALPSPQKTCNLKGNMIDPCITQDISDHLKWTVFRMIRDPRWASCPARVMQHLRIPTHRLSATQTTIYGFNADGTRPMGKIKLKCQIGDLKSEVTCYVIDADTSYNLLLGRSWIHRNSIVPSTLHQVMKYTDEEEKVRMLITKWYPFKGVENYFTDSLPIRILLRLMRIHTLKNPTLAMK